MQTKRLSYSQYFRADILHSKLSQNNVSYVDCSLFTILFTDMNNARITVT